MITQKGLIKFSIMVAVIAIAFVVAFSYIGIEFNERMALAIVGFSLLSALLISGHNKGVFHQGHFPITFGIVFVAIGILMFWGTLDYTYRDGDGELQQKGQLWDLTSQESGIFILLIVVGVYSIYEGARQAMGASYFWGMRHH